jgi:hypothetical protein
MSLKGLTFTTLPKIGTGANPVMDRRAMTIKRLEEQKLLLADATFTRTINVMVKGENGAKTKQEKSQKVLPWWTSQTNGSVVFFIRLGWKPIEFSKGQSGIAVPSLDKLPEVIDTLITAVRNGELDEQLAQAAAVVKKALARKTPVKKAS